MSNGEQGRAWFKSSYSGSQGDDCIEIAITERTVHVRDSKDITHPSFAVGEHSWGQFVRFTSEH